MASKSTRLDAGLSETMMRDRAARIAGAIDDDPLEILAVASICASSMQEDAAALIDQLASHDLRLSRVLHVAVGSLPFVDHLVAAKDPVDPAIPGWLTSLDDARVTAMKRRWIGRSQSVYLTEVTFVGGMVGTTVALVEHHPNDEVIGFWTTAGCASTVASSWSSHHGASDTGAGDADRSRAIELADGCQDLLFALDGSLHSTVREDRWRPPWPLNLPALALVVNIAMAQVDRFDHHPYLAARRGVSSSSCAAVELRAKRSAPPHWATPPTKDPNEG